MKKTLTKTQKETLSFIDDYISAKRFLNKPVEVISVNKKIFTDIVEAYRKIEESPDENRGVKLSFDGCYIYRGIPIKKAV